MIATVRAAILCPLLHRRRRRLPPLPASSRSQPCLSTSPLPWPVQEIVPFEEPKIELEQYPTGPHLASRLLYTVRLSLLPLLAAAAAWALFIATTAPAQRP